MQRGDPLAPHQVTVTHHWRCILFLFGVGHCCVPFGGLHRAAGDSPEASAQRNNIGAYMLAVHKILGAMRIPLWIGKWANRKKYLLPGDLDFDGDGDGDLGWQYPSGGAPSP